MFGNQFIQNTFVTITATCTTSNTSTAVTGCTGYSGTVLAGMVVSGENVPTPFPFGTSGAGQPINSNTFAFGPDEVSAVAGGSVTLTNATNSSGAGTGTLYFCWPVLSMPYLWNYNTNYDVTWVGNVYVNAEYDAMRYWRRWILISAPDAVCAMPAATRGPL